MRKMITASEWYPVYTIHDCLLDECAVDIPDDVIFRVETATRLFLDAQEELRKLYVPEKENT